VARKLVRVNVSDLLAKGARPVEALLTLGWPNSRSEDELEQFAYGLSSELSEWNIGLVGGDTVSAPQLFASLTLIGGPFHSNIQPVWQDGAQAGDSILLTGKIGGNIGLADARGERPTPAAAHYHTPEIPTLEAASLVCLHATAATDVSDGLLADLGQMLDRSDVGGAINLEAVRLWRESNDINEILAQCTGGDDYQIVCTATPNDAEKLIASGIFYKIGSVNSAHGLQLNLKGNSVNLPETLGFEHGD